MLLLLHPRSANLVAPPRLVTPSSPLVWCCKNCFKVFRSQRPRIRSSSDSGVLPMLMPERKDHIQAAELRNTCRRNGVQVGTIDALLAQMCIRYGLVILTTDKDFRNAATLLPLSVWTQ